MQISSLVTAICPKKQNLRQYEAAHQIWCKSVNNWPRYTCLFIVEDGGYAILNFTKTWILGHSNPNTANVNRPTKFDADISLMTAVSLKNKIQMADAAILNFQRMLFWESSTTRTASVKGQ